MNPQHEHISRVPFLVCFSVFACTPVHSNSPTTSRDSLACIAGALTKQLSDLPLSKHVSHTCLTLSSSTCVFHSRVLNLGVSFTSQAQSWAAWEVRVSRFSPPRPFFGGPGSFSSAERISCSIFIGTDSATLLSSPPSSSFGSPSYSDAWLSSDARSRTPLAHPRSLRQDACTQNFTILSSQSSLSTSASPTIAFRFDSHTVSRQPGTSTHK